MNLLKHTTFGRFFILFSAVLLSITGCKEIPPFIDYSTPILLARDTTYVLNSTPEAQNKNVLIEDISGVRCINCPEAAEIAHDIQDKNQKGRVIVMTLHTTKIANFTRPYSDTFNTDEATFIVDNLIDGDVSGLPTGSIDRKIYAGKTDALLKPATWESFVNGQLLLKTKANLDLDLVVDKESRSVIANVKATFLTEFPEGAYLSLFITESHILSHQLVDTGVQADFEHNFILRKGITPYTGIKLAPTIEANRVFEKGFEFTIPEKWNFENCNIVVLLNPVKPGANDVIQTKEKSIKP